MVHITEERMSDAFLKLHIHELPFPAVLHRFTAPDLGDPHDHPWPFRTFILHGGYTEEVYDLHGGLIDIRQHHEGDSFLIDAGHIHRITELHGIECWTIILPKPGEARTSGFYQFRDDGAYHRFHHETEWRRV